MFNHKNHILNCLAELLANAENDQKHATITLDYYQNCARVITDEGEILGRCSTLFKGLESKDLVAMQFRAAILKALGNLKQNELQNS